MKNWRTRFFTVHARPAPTLSYYRDAGKQQRPTQVLHLQGAKVEASALSNATEACFTYLLAALQAYQALELGKLDPQAMCPRSPEQCANAFYLE